MIVGLSSGPTQRRAERCLQTSVPSSRSAQSRAWSMSGCVYMHVEFAPAAVIWCLGGRGMVPTYLQIPSMYLFSLAALFPPRCPPSSVSPPIPTCLPKVDDIARSNEIVIYGSYYPKGKWAAISRASTHARAAAAAARIWSRWRRRAESATW